MSRFFVAGATGFLGSWVARSLREAGHSSTLVSRRGGELDGIPVAAVDLEDPVAVEKAAHGCEGAFLCHGFVSREREDAEALHRVHVTNTKTALGALRAAGVRRVVHASTSGTVAVGSDSDPDRAPDESAAPPTELILGWPYYRAKYYGEREALEANQAGFEVVVVNPSLLLGPGDERESSTGDVRKFLERSIPAVPAGGMAFVDARDAAAGMIAAFEKGRAGERYLLNAKNLTIAAFFERLERLTGVAAPKLRLPRSPVVAVGMTRLFSRAVRAIGGTPPVEEISVEMAQYYWYCDSAKAERELGWKARDPGETLRDTVEDLIERKRAFPRGRALDVVDAG